MKARIDLWMNISDQYRSNLEDAMDVESRSSPPGGEVTVSNGHESEPLLSMVSDDLSTSRAMLNSYLGLVSAAMDLLEE